MFCSIFVTTLSRSWFDNTAYLNGSTPRVCLCIYRVLQLIPKHDAIFCHVIPMDTQWEICSVAMLYWDRPGWLVKVVGGIKLLVTSVDICLASCSCGKLRKHLYNDPSSLLTSLSWPCLHTARYEDSICVSSSSTLFSLSWPKLLDHLLCNDSMHRRALVKENLHHPQHCLSLGLEKQRGSDEHTFWFKYFKFSKCTCTSKCGVFKFPSDDRKAFL